MVLEKNFCIQLTKMEKQEVPEGPGTLTCDRRILRVPFFHRFMYNRRHLGGLNLKTKALLVYILIV